jgi:hypothetical protein
MIKEELETSINVQTFLPSWQISDFHRSKVKADVRSLIDTGAIKVPCTLSGILSQL